MRRLLSIFAFFCCGPAFCGSTESQLDCKSESGEESGIALSSNREIFFIKNSARGCGSEYTYREYADGAKGFLVISSPGSDDLGLNAQNMIYFVPSGGKEVNYIGDIPASATELEDGTYQNIVQSGGSIFESVYKLSSEKITILSPSRELIISDTQCIYQRKDSKACKKMSGRFKKPLCVINYGGQKVAADIDECSGMSEG
ncbi:hypothetical protein [Pseudomonas chlororaphis]|uniref:Lipoprotein n=1 Tax=Pseudomonas chlororaphis subsp. aureofaciens TaxID=587851 RepID=A0AAD0ZPQ8_9PSED|nr:hypothetical protein [Pseudomonas chlororaphis]AZE32920.1 hypothetical protein C4K07_6180 [Pseudomonas chlororaphis subsp. aureofaciens]